MYEWTNPGGHFVIIYALGTELQDIENGKLHGSGRGVGGVIADHSALEGGGDGTDVVSAIVADGFGLG